MGESYREIDRRLLLKSAKLYEVFNQQDYDRETQGEFGACDVTGTRIHEAQFRRDLKKIIEEFRECASKDSETIFLLKSQLEKAKEALHYYANPDNHDREGIFEHVTRDENGKMTDYWVDYGDTARDALKGLENE